MIKLKEILIPNLLYHVADEENLSSIRKEGISTRHSNYGNVVFLFKDKREIKIAIKYWIGWTTGRNLVILTINPHGLSLVPTKDKRAEKIEILSYETIPWSNVIDVEYI